MGVAGLDGPNHEKGRARRKGSESRRRIFGEALARSGVGNIGTQGKPADAERTLARLTGSLRPRAQVVCDRSRNAQRPIRIEHGAQPFFMAVVTSARKMLRQTQG